MQYLLSTIDGNLVKVRKWLWLCCVRMYAPVSLTITPLYPASLNVALNLAVGCKSCAAELSDMDVIPRDTGLSTKCRCGVSCLFLPHESEDKDSLLKWSLKNWMHSCQPTQCIQFWPSVDQQCREKRCCTGSSPAVQCPQECTSHPFTFIYVLPSRCF